MVARLGNVIYWTFSAISVLIIAYMFLMIRQYPSMSSQDHLIVWIGTIIAAGFVWLIGRAARYVLAGT